MRAFDIGMLDPAASLRTCVSPDRPRALVEAPVTVPLDAGIAVPGAEMVDILRHRRPPPFS